MQHTCRCAMHYGLLQALEPLPERRLHCHGESCLYSFLLRLLVCAAASPPHLVSTVHPPASSQANSGIAPLSLSKKLFAIASRTAWGACFGSCADTTRGGGGGGEDLTILLHGLATVMHTSICRQHGNNHATGSFSDYTYFLFMASGKHIFT